MKRIAIVAAVVFTLVGCSAAEPVEPAPEAPAVEPAPEPTSASPEAEAAYLDKLVASMPPGVDSPEARSAVLEMGYRFCDSAAKLGTSTAEAAQVYIDALDTQADGYMLMMGTALLGGQYAGEYLCP